MNLLVLVMRVLQLGLVVGVLLACGRLSNNPGHEGSTSSPTIAGTGTSSTPQKRTTDPAPYASENPVRDMLLDAGVSMERMEAEHLELTTEEVDRMHVALFGELAVHTKEELRIIAFVESYLDKMRPPVARPRRFLVYREPRGWAVSVITLEALKRFERAPGLVVHVAEDKGRLRITHLTNNG